MKIEQNFQKGLWSAGHRMLHRRGSLRGNRLSSLVKGQSSRSETELRELLLAAISFSWLYGIL